MTRQAVRDREAPLEAACRVLSPGDLPAGCGGRRPGRATPTVLNQGVEIARGGQSRRVPWSWPRPPADWAATTRPGAHAGQRRPCAGPAAGRDGAGDRLRLRADHPVPRGALRGGRRRGADAGPAAVARARTRDLSGRGVRRHARRRPAGADLRRRGGDRRARARRRGHTGPGAVRCPSSAAATPCSRTGGTLVVADREPARASSTSQRRRRRTTPTARSTRSRATRSSRRRGRFPRRALERCSATRGSPTEVLASLPRLQAAAGRS